MVEALGRKLILVGQEVHDFASLLVSAFWSSLTPPFRLRETLQQLSFVAWESAPVVLLSVSFAAAVTIMEASFHMKIVVQNDSLVPGFAALLILRELGVVVTALLVTSRVGAGYAAEVGSMQITEQVEALKMLGIHPIRYLLVPRLYASILGLMILTVVANMVCIYVAMLVSQWSLGYSSGSFLMAMRAFVGLQDLLFSVIKAGVFGAVIPIYSIFFGLRCRAGAEGVGLATTSAVVATSVTIIILDFILSYIFSFFY